MNIKPSLDNILIEEIKEGAEENKSASGLIMPSNSNEATEHKTGIVIAIGPGRRNDAGEFLPLTVKVGDKVIYGAYGPGALKVEGKDYVMAKEASILAVIEDGK